MSPPTAGGFQYQRHFCLKTHHVAGIHRIKIYNRDPPRDIEPVHNSVTAMTTGKPLLVHGDQETRQLELMQGQSGFMLVQALSTPRGVHWDLF